MRHRGRTQTVSFRMSGKALDELERQAADFGISLGEFSRAAVDRHLKNEEFREVLRIVEALAEENRRVAETLLESFAAARTELEALRRDFNLAVGRADDRP